MLGFRSNHCRKCRERGADRQKGWWRGGQRHDSSFSTWLPQGCSISFLLPPQRQHFRLPPGCFCPKQGGNPSPGCCSLTPPLPRRFPGQPHTENGVQDEYSLSCSQCPSAKVSPPYQILFLHLCLPHTSGDMLGDSTRSKVSKTINFSLIF